MAEPAGEDRQIHFSYEYEPTYRLFPANGIWAGITPRGDLRLDFFVESHVVPSEVVHLVSPEGKIGNELRRVPGGAQGRNYVRRMQAGILLSLDHADNIADFIKSQVRDFRKRQEERGK